MPRQNKPTTDTADNSSAKSARGDLDHGVQLTLDLEANEHNHDGTPCCGAPFVWVSFNPEFPKNAGKVDHLACMECDKPCERRAA